MKHLAHRIVLVAARVGLSASAATLSAATADATSELKSFGTMGKEATTITAGQETELFRHEAKGCLTHMWFGGDWRGYERTRIRVYVDGESQPGIDLELGLGHGVGFGDGGAPWGSQKLGKTGHPSGLYNTYRIPFGQSVRVTAQLGEGVPGNPPFWWILRGTENLRVTLGGVTLPERARLRLHKRDGYAAQPLEEFALCDVKGDGALYQVTIAAKGRRVSPAGNQKWTDLSFLEACMRAYIGGTSKPLMLSSGLEDYFLGTYYFNRGRYANALAGLTHLDTQANSFSAYRFHDEDPVFFRNGLRLTCRCGEMVDGRVIGNPPETDYTTYTWIYQW